LRFAAKEQANSKKKFKKFQKISMGGGIANGKLYKANRGNFSRRHFDPKKGLFRANFFGMFFDQHFSCVLKQKNGQTRKHFSKKFWGTF
jgi:hypothetical protein